MRGHAGAGAGARARARAWRRAPWRAVTAVAQRAAARRSGIAGGDATPQRSARAATARAAGTRARGRAFGRLARGAATGTSPGGATRRGQSPRARARSHFDHSFGPGHFFRLHAPPTIYEGYPRFYYGGYNFTIVDPWPAYWGDAWYDADELFISWDGDGYYLHDRRYPDMALAVTVNL